MMRLQTKSTSEWKVETETSCQRAGLGHQVNVKDEENGGPPQGCLLNSSLFFPKQC